MAIRPPLPPNPLRSARRQRQERLLATRSLRDSLISLAGIIHGPVVNQSGDEIGTLVDVVARWDGEEPYPPVTGLVVEVGRRVAFVGIDQVERRGPRPGPAALGPARPARLRARPGEVMLGRDVVDHQLVDVDGVQVIRAADLYLAWVTRRRPPAGRRDTKSRVLRLVGADVSAQTLLRRLGPKRWRGRPTPDEVIDWAAIQPFSGEVRQRPAAVVQRRPAPAAPGRAGRPAGGSGPARPPGAAGQPRARDGGRRPGGDGPRGARARCCGRRRPSRPPSWSPTWSPTRRSTPSATSTRTSATSSSSTWRTSSARSLSNCWSTTRTPPAAS